MLKQKSKGLKSNNPSLYPIEFGGFLKAALWHRGVSVRLMATCVQKILLEIFVCWQ
jgi:hypothetical protein